MLTDSSPQTSLNDPQVHVASTVAVPNAGTSETIVDEGHSATIVLPLLDELVRQSIRSTTDISGRRGPDITAFSSSSSSSSPSPSSAAVVVDTSTAIVPKRTTYLEKREVMVNKSVFQWDAGWGSLVRIYPLGFYPIFPISCIVALFLPIVYQTLPWLLMTTRRVMSMHASADGVSFAWHVHLLLDDAAYRVAVAAPCRLLAVVVTCQESGDGGGQVRTTTSGLEPGNQSRKKPPRPHLDGAGRALVVSSHRLALAQRVVVDSQFGSRHPGYLHQLDPRLTAGVCVAVTSHGGHS